MDSGKLLLFIFLIYRKFRNLGPLKFIKQIKKLWHIQCFVKMVLDLFAKKFVEFDGIWSDAAFFNTGVPQGSIPGPLLFLIYMKDIDTTANKLYMILYADDTNLISMLCSFNSSFSGEKCEVKYMSEEINTELRNIQEWLNINTLSLTLNKTKCMIADHHQGNIMNITPTPRTNLEPVERFRNSTFSDSQSTNISVGSHTNRRYRIK